MEKQLEMLSVAADHYIRVAEKVAKYADYGDLGEEDDAEEDGGAPSTEKRPKTAETREQLLRKIRKMMIKNILLENETRNQFSALEKAKEKFSKLPDLLIEKEFERLFSELPVLTEEEAKEHEKYIRLEDVIRENMKDDVPEGKVKNRICGHLYEKNHIIKLLENDNGTRIRCPMLGCTNKTLRKEDLIPNQVYSQRRKSAQKQVKALTRS